MNLKKEDIHNIIIVGSFLILAFLFYLYTEPSLTGLTILQNSQQITFDTSSDYAYNSSLIEINNGDVSLKSQEITSTWVTYNYTTFGILKAYYDYSNRTSKVDNLDANNYTLEDEEIFEISFSDFLDNGDIITLFTKSHQEESMVYLCNATSICDNTNNYGAVNYNGSETEFILDIENLPNPMKSFTLIAVDEIIIDFINSSKGPIVNAFADPEDKTYKLISKNNDELEVEDDKMLNLIFSEPIQNNDTLSLYLDDESTSNISVCQSSDFCSENYGEVYFPNIDGWYNITISNLPYPINTLALINDNKIDLDYIEVHRATPNYYLEINYTYENASIETQEFSLNPAAISANLTSEETLNGQQILYYYSLDSGAYNLIDSNISLNNASKIKFKAELITNSTETPVLSSLTFTYDYNFCEELWTCTIWSECSGLSLQTRTCTDLSSCGTTSFKPIETQSCIKTNYEVNNSETISIYRNETININSTNLELKILGNSEVTGVNITITRENNDTNLPGKRVLDDFNIEVDDELNNNINLTEFKVYYNENEIGNILESTLKLYYFNKTDSTWKALPSILNTEENYLVINLTHFSTYGVFGEESPPTSSTNSGNSGGKSSFIRPSQQQETETVKVETPQKAAQESQQEAEFEESKEQETLPLLTGETIAEIEEPSMKKKTNWFLIGLIILNVLFILRANSKKKPKRKIIEQDEKRFGIN